MFANVFNNEEKENLIELIFKIANCDGEFVKEEKELIENYKVEFGISEIKDTASMEEIVEYFSNKTNQIKRIVFFEIYGMIISDGIIAKEQENILKIITEKFNLDIEVYQDIIDAVNELQAVYDKIYDVLF